MDSTGMNEVQEASRALTYRPLKSGSNSNANDNAGKPLGFGDVLFTEKVASAPVPVIEAPLFQEALAA